jgi:predicted aspartyl protease
MVRKLCFLLFVFVNMNTVKSNNKTDDIDSILHTLFTEREYFKLRDALEKYDSLAQPGNKLYYQAKILNVFNLPEESNKSIEQLLSIEKDSLKLLQLNRIKADNFIRRGEFDSASKVYNTILQDFNHNMNDAELEAVKNELVIWSSLAGVPKQEIYMNSDAFIPLHKDKIGFLKVSVTVDGNEHDFIIDTGANLNLISESFCKKFGFPLLDSDFFIMTGTGQSVKAKLAIADKIYLNTIEIHNACFLVIPDNMLKFGLYRLNGIIGFPIINQLGEIQICNKEKHIKIPVNTTETSLQNLALDGLMPIINIGHRDVEMPFVFDTGANISMLYSKFFENYKEEIESKYHIKNYRIASVGSNRKLKTHVLKDICISVGNQPHCWKKIRLVRDELYLHSKYYCGSIGRDVHSNFDIITINFKDMFIKFD